MKTEKKRNWTLDNTGTGQWKQTKQCVTEKKNTNGHQKTRYEKNIKCSDNTHLPPKRNNYTTPTSPTNKGRTKTEHRVIELKALSFSIPGSAVPTLMTCSPSKLITAWGAQYCETGPPTCRAEASRHRICWNFEKKTKNKSY